MPLKKNKKIKEIKVGDLIAEASFLLKKIKIERPELEAELLLAFILKRDRVFLLSHPEYNIDLKTKKQFLSLIKKRIIGWSSAVLLGHKEFYGLDFLVNRHVLVPRPETEILVDQILAEVSPEKTLIIDIGTGSGAIICSLFKKLEARKNINFLASDKSKSALKQATANAKRFKAKITFLNGDLLKPYLPIFKKIKPENLIIAANLPYLKPEELQEPSIKKEPKNALVSGKDGLWHYRRLFCQLQKIRLNKVFLICEINPQQKINIKKLAQSSFPESKIDFIKDYRQQTRFLVVKF